MDKKASMLTKMADLILKSANRSEAFAKSKEKSNKIKVLHESLTDKYRFNITKGYDINEVKNDIDFVKKVQTKVSLTESENKKLESLFFKYRI
tara:strand:+ start:268 stop:546 length:279 start_codon:yes stop_codon:yes gene_type:complete